MLNEKKFSICAAQKKIDADRSVLQSNEPRRSMYSMALKCGILINLKVSCCNTKKPCFFLQARRCFFLFLCIVFLKLMFLFIPHVDKKNPTSWKSYEFWLNVLHIV